MRQEDADNARLIEYQEEYQKIGTLHTAYKLENVTDYEQAIDYVKSIKQTNDFGVSAAIGWRDEMGKMQYRNTNTVDVNETGTLMAHISELLGRYNLDYEDIEELRLEFQGET